MFSEPEELLQAVVECIANNMLSELPSYPWKYTRSELVSLSSVNQQFRRLCLPFLFARVSVRADDDLDRLIEQCTINGALATSIRTLDAWNSSDPAYQWFPSAELISNTLALLPNLSQINLYNIFPKRDLLIVLDCYLVSTTFMSSGRSFASRFNP